MLDKMSIFAIIVILVMSVAICKVRNEREEYRHQLEAATARIEQMERAAKLDAEIREKAQKYIEAANEQAKRNTERTERALSGAQKWTDDLLPASVRELFSETATASDVSATGGTLETGNDTAN